MSSLLPLSLLVLGVLADDSNDALAPDHLALRADPPDGRFDLHLRESFFLFGR
jgi:hypothetical protein